MNGKYVRNSLFPLNIRKLRVQKYLGTAKNGANQGRMNEIATRVKHLDNIEAIGD